jgi:NADPH:quinone reductase-like Zn-dependent oxidoreductase
MTVAATRLRLDAKAADIGAFAPRVEHVRLERGDDQAIVRVAAAAVNPSDAKAALGLMPHAAWPRTPGRDYAGIVEEGPSAWVGAEVWGSSGDLGIRRDGTHATHVLVPAAALRRKPASLSLREAGAIGVPFVTAWEGYRRSGLPQAGETVLVLGLNGKVGQAAAQIAAWRGARVIGVVRRDEPYAGHACAPIGVVNAGAADVAVRVRALTEGRGADIVFNTVGDPYFDAAHRSLAIRGRQILIAAVNRIAAFNIFEFYRGQHSYVGIDTLALDCVATADVLAKLAPGFEGGQLKPFATMRCFALAVAEGAYAAVLSAARDRIVILPDA